MELIFDETEEVFFGKIRVIVGKAYGILHDEDGGTSAGPTVYGAYFPADAEDNVPGAIGYGWAQAPAIAALFNSVNFG